VSERVFRIGQRVRVIAGPRAGEETTIVSGLYPFDGQEGDGIKRGDAVYDTDLVSLVGHSAVVAKPAWLAPVDDADRAVAAEMDSWLDRVVRKGRVGV
jgi:hypothetical protein